MGSSIRRRARDTKLQMQPHVEYRIDLSERHAHLVSVEARFPGGGGDVDLKLPVWTPGSYLVREFAGIGERTNGCQIVAVCDVYRKRARENAEKLKCDSTLDYREVINRPDIDAVLIATPDHWHAKIALEAMDRGRWVILNLDKGRLGEQASTLGSLLLAKIKNALFARKRRQLFTLYCDEIQNLVAYDAGLDTLLSEARKFGISVVSANQFLEQYPPQMRAAIMAVGTHVFFQLSSTDADKIAAALSLGRDLAGVITYDDRMTDGARALGLEVEAPGAP